MMTYYHMDKGGVFVSKSTDLQPTLGFGMMRLPMVEEECNIPVLEKMVDTFISSGFNYFDTAYMYCGGKSEAITGEVLVKRYPREAFRLATKLPRWELQSKEDRDKVFAEQLQRTGAGYFDYYLLHAVSDVDDEDGYTKFDCFTWLAQKKKEGLVKKIGFSFHGSTEFLDKILTRHPEIEFVQLQLNYMDWDNPLIQSRKQYEIARKHGKEIIVMEPVKGGALADADAQVKEAMHAAHPGESPASWAFRYVAALEGVSLILSGMSDQQQTEDNIKTFKSLAPLTDQEKQVLDMATQAKISSPAVPCTACEYCLEGCPQNIQIPKIFDALSAVRMYGDVKSPMGYYKKVASIEDQNRAENCIQCGQCEDICPQHLPIVNLLQEASSKFDVEPEGAATT